jgi:hypothetical protein
MRLSGWCRVAAIVLLLGGFLGCVVPSSSPGPPLTVAAAKHTLDTWNPTFCKVAEFYGFYQAGNNAAEQVAYVLLANPSDKAANPVVFAARFQLLTGPEGQSRWFLSSLMTQGEGLTRRRGWDNLLVQVKAPPAPAKAK